MSEWTVETLKEYIDSLRKADREGNDQRFKAAENAVKTAEANRDNAINKAEASIEKKSDAVYVKLTDLQKAFSDVMLRPEIEGRFKGIEEKLGTSKTFQDSSIAKGSGMKDLWALIVGAIFVLIAVITFLSN